MTSGQPHCDISIDPHYHRTPYFRQVKQTSTESGLPTFCVYIGKQTSAMTPQ